MGVEGATGETNTALSAVSAFDGLIESATTNRNRRRLLRQRRRMLQEAGEYQGPPVNHTLFRMARSDWLMCSRGAI